MINIVSVQKVKKSKEKKLKMRVWGRGIEGSLRVHI
jgi:hypothetical protein